MPKRLDRPRDRSCPVVVLQFAFERVETCGLVERHHDIVGRVISPGLRLYLFCFAYKSDSDGQGQEGQKELESQQRLPEPVPASHCAVALHDIYRLKSRNIERGICGSA